MNVDGKVLLITGANRGIGNEIVRQAVQRGARRVYACSRNNSVVGGGVVVPVELDVSDHASIERCANACGDTEILINNAGVMVRGPLLTGDGLRSVRSHIDVNAMSILAMAAAFAPVLRGNGGGAIINMLSVLSWISIEDTGAYSVSKAAAWAITNSLRLELKEQKTRVMAVHPGYVDTDMTAGLNVPKMSVTEAVTEIYEAFNRGEAELVLSEIGQWVKQNLSSPSAPYLA